MKTLVTSLLIAFTTYLYSQQIDIEWETNIGGSYRDEAYSMSLTTDGGFIIAGLSDSMDGDVGGNNGIIDYWIVKLDDIGSLVWETNLGGSNNDQAYSIDQTSDGGYIVAGLSFSNDGDVGGNNGESDYWIVKLNDTGSIIWETNLGGSLRDAAYSIEQTSDEGFIVAGYTLSNNGDVGGNYGNFDYWIVKLNDTGSLIWETNLGGSSTDIPSSIHQTNDGGYIVAGFSYSNDGDVGGNWEEEDYWIVKLDDTGNLIWETNLGGNYMDIANSIQQTIDGGYIVAGLSYSTDGDLGGNNGGTDYWIVKLDDTGSMIWEANFGGDSEEIAYDIQQTIDGGFIIVGESDYASDDVGGNNGWSDYWVVKLDNTGSMIWETNLGGSFWDIPRSIKQTIDGDFIVTGLSYSDDGDVGGNNGGYDYWIVKLKVTTLGLEDNLLSKNIILSPNPTTNTITIANLSQEIAKIELLDMQGRIVLSKSEVINNTINISSLQPATYIVKIYVGRTIFYKNVIKK